MSDYRSWFEKAGRSELRLRLSRAAEGEAAPQPGNYPLRIIRRSEVLERIGLSAMQLWRKEKVGRFPQCVRLGPNSVGYLEHEVDAWIRRRAAERDLPDDGSPPEPD